jgi:hypothetical protein
MLNLPDGFDREEITRRIFQVLHEHEESEDLRYDEEAGGYTRPGPDREQAEAFLAARILGIVAQEFARVQSATETEAGPPTTTDGAGDGSAGGG